MNLKDKKVIVIGLARTGAAVARYCRGLGARVLVLEKSPEPAEPDQAAALLSMGIEVSYGDHDLKVLDGVVVPSPGVPPTNPVLSRAIAAGLPVVSEIELAFQFTDRPVIAVTGTNGKTTTVTLIGEMLRAAGKEADVCGNIGRPMIEAIGPAGSATAPLIVEASSFQLEFTDKFRPRIGVLLNLAPDHLDWHQDMESYRRAKLNIFRRQTAGDWAITSDDCASLAAGAGGRKLTFGGRTGVFVEDGWICHDLHGPAVKIIAVDELEIRGGHNIANAMAAAAVALMEGVGEEVIARTLREFKGVEHRLEAVMSENGVLFYNDSKATNPAAAITALKAFSEPIILLAGGRNKGNSFDELAQEAAGRVKLAVLFGESAPDLAEALAERAVPTAGAATFAEAVKTASAAARPGDVVLLAPACASFDMFADYEERGRAFKTAVRAKAGSLGAR